MRSAGGTKVGAPCWVVSATNFKMACFEAPSFHEGKGSAARAETAVRATTETEQTASGPTVSFTTIS